MTKKSLDEQVMELENQLDQEVEKPDEEETTEDTVEEDVVDEPAEEEKPEVKVEVKEVKPEIDPLLAYQLREAKRRERELEEENKQLKAPKKEVQEETPPNAEEDPVGYLAWELRNTKKTVEELTQYRQRNEELQRAAREEQQKATIFTSDAAIAEQKLPDLGTAIDHMYEQIKKGAKLADPNLSPAQLDKMARDKVLNWGAEYKRQGMNAAEALYQVSQQYYGYEFKAPTDPVPEPTKIQKASLATIEKNKSKSASGIGVGSTKSNVITAESLSKMNLTEIEKNKEEIIAAGFGDFI